MSRKRVSESDLLDFRRRADELSEEVGAKYSKMDEVKKASKEPEPVCGFGLLLLHDTSATAGQLKSFADRARQSGIAIELVDFCRRAPRSRFDRTPEWQRWLDAAQSGYLSISARAEKVCVVGSGNSCALAALIAEQYPVDKLVVVGGGLKRRSPFGLFCDKRKRSESRVSRVARNNLFAIVCPILSILTDKCGDCTRSSASAYRSGTRSDDVQTLELSGSDVANVWTDKENDIADAIFGFLRG